MLRLLVASARAPLFRRVIASEMPSVRLLTRLVRAPASGSSLRAPARVRPSLSRCFSEAAEEEAPKTTALSTRIISGKNVRKLPKYSFFLLLFGAGCIGTVFIAKEVIPTSLSSTGMYDDAFGYLKSDQRILNYFGTPMKAYGKEYDGFREGRRNTVESFSYNDESGQKCLRIQFHIRGPRAKGVVYCEKTKGMNRGDFRYLIVQVPSSGDVISVMDHREPVTRDVLQQQVAQKLSQVGALLFGRNSCPFTQRQREELGASQYMVKYIDCDQESEMCDRFQIRQYPTWIVHNRSLTGMRTIEELDRMFQMAY